MFNISFTLAAEVCGSQSCGYVASYPVSLQDASTPNELRGWACIRGTFLKSWVICATHLSVAQAKANAQAQYFRNSVLGPENNLRTKVGGGDFNLRPRPYGSGTYGLSHMYEQYREADQYYYDLVINNSTRKPPASYPNQKIDYVFAGRFWTVDHTGKQDRRCDTGSDHCLIIGSFTWP